MAGSEANESGRGERKTVRERGVRRTVTKNFFLNTTVSLGSMPWSASDCVGCSHGVPIICVGGGAFGGGGGGMRASEYSSGFLMSSCGRRVRTGVARQDMSMELEA